MHKPDSRTIKPPGRPAKGGSHHNLIVSLWCWLCPSLSPSPGHLIAPVPRSHLPVASGLAGAATGSHRKAGHQPDAWRKQPHAAGRPVRPGKEGGCPPCWLSTQGHRNDKDRKGVATVYEKLRLPA